MTSGHDRHGDGLLGRLTEAGRAGLTGRDLYHALFGAPALPPRAERLERIGEGYRTALRLTRGCPYARRGVLAGFSAVGLTQAEG